MDLLSRRTGRMALFTALYASEGAPIGFIWWALPTVLRLEGLPIAEITGLTAVLVLPWAFKFAWAPLVDALRTPRWGFKAWIITAQAVMGLTLLPLVWLEPIEHLGAWRTLLLLHAVAAATQDVAIDAFAINVVPARDRGMLNGSMQAGMLGGRSLFGGGVLLVASSLGREWLVVALIAWIWLSLLVLLAAREPADLAPAPGRAREFRRHLRAALAKPLTWWGLAFALLSAAAFEAAGQLAGPYLVDRGVGEAAIGTFFGVFVVGAMLAGVLVGGRLADRWGRPRAVGWSLVAFVVAVGLLGLADRAGLTANPGVPLVLLTAMYLGIGLFTAASYALFMDLTDPRLGGTQFSAFMSATNACEAWSGWAGGRLAASSGYSVAFLVMSAVSLASLPLVGRLGARSRPPR